MANEDVGFSRKKAQKKRKKDFELAVSLEISGPQRGWGIGL